MRGRVPECLAGVGGAGQFGAVRAEHHRADRHVRVTGAGGCRDRRPDQPFVASGIVAGASLSAPLLASAAPAASSPASSTDAPAASSPALTDRGGRAPRRVPRRIPSPWRCGPTARRDTDRSRRGSPQHRVRQSDIGQDAEIALLEGVGFLEILRGDVGVEGFQRLGGDVVVQRRGRIRQQQPGARRGRAARSGRTRRRCPAARTPLRRCAIPQFGLRRGQAGQHLGAHRGAPPLTVFADHGHAEAVGVSAESCGPAPSRPAMLPWALTVVADQARYQVIGRRRHTPAGRGPSGCVCQPGKRDEDTRVRARAGVDRRVGIARSGGGRTRRIRLQPVRRGRAGRPHGRVRGHHRSHRGADVGRRPQRADRAGRADARGVDAARPHQGRRPGLPVDRRDQRQGGRPGRGAGRGPAGPLRRGHPMAGTAHSGWAAGNARLAAGAPWVLSVDEHVDARVWSR